jgi:hypothetical protein
MVLYDDYNTTDDIESELAFEELQDILTELNQTANQFLITGTLGLWYGQKEGGAIITDLTNITRHFEDYSILKLINGKLHLETCHHDGTNTFDIVPLTEKGQEFADRHYYDMTDRELHIKLKNTKGLTKKFDYAVSFC